MVNATQMAKTFGKKPAEWLRFPSTSQFIDTLLAIRKSDRSEAMGKSHRSEFIKTINGVGTWFHQDVALDFT
ncbi:KilA-N domain protein [Petrimonas sp. IBARAKI]|nr:KilA-N domain protein [Petrimonas sp. IBARAKI]